MKRFMLLPIALLFAFMLVGCNNNNDRDEDTVEKGTPNNAVDTTKDNKVNDNNNNNNNAGTNDVNTTITSADEVATKLVQQNNEIESANVLTTANNAYVAVVLKEGTKETEALKTKVADLVRASSGRFENVYVSFNPDFAKQLADYRTRINSNEPVEGLFDEFSDTIKRVFPDAK